MLTPIEIENAVSQILRKKTSFKVYEQDVKKSFAAPCFFVSCELKNFKASNKNTFSVTADISIFFFSPRSGNERTRNEELALKVMGMLPTWFTPNFKVGDRYLTTGFVNTDFVGDDADILCCTFSSTYFDSPSGEGTDIVKIENIILNSKEEF